MFLLQKNYNHSFFSLIDLNRLFLRHQKSVVTNDNLLTNYKSFSYLKVNIKVLQILKSLRYYDGTSLSGTYNYFLYRKLYKQSSLGDVSKPLLYNKSSSQLNVHFLKKERLYTKLKYSRSPAYDIVSGGAAALLAGFLGFLVSEKYGFELVDSGDFYYLFMYIVFLTFSLRPLLNSLDLRHNFKQIFSLRIFWEFYFTILYLFVYKIKY